MNRRTTACVLAVAGIVGGLQFRSAPPVINAGPPPGDAIVLFDGTTTSEFVHMDGRPCEWKIDGGAMVVQPRSGSIISKRVHGDAQIHIEFATPSEVKGEGQGRGNSGVYVQSRYEVQVLDSFDNETYPNGQCGAIYGQHPPLVNASRPPGEWQTYDIIFRAPRKDEAGNVTEPGRMTVLHNGVLIQNAVPISRPTTAHPAGSKPGPAPLYLQDHGNPVRYRNIWIRPLN